MPVWTNVIGVVLAALALGGWLGGKAADRWPSPRTAAILLGAAGALAAAAAPLGPWLARSLLPGGIDLEGIARLLEKGSLLSTLLAFGPPMVLLGGIGPVTVRLLVDGGVGAGRAAGLVAASGTAGSLVGTFATTHLLLPSLGTRATVLDTGIALLAAAAGVAALGAWRRPAAALLVLAGAAGGLHACTGGWFRPGEGVLAEYDTAYQFLQVREVADAAPGGRTVRTRLLTMNEGVSTYHSVWREGSVLTGGRYYDLYPLLPVLAGAVPGGDLDVAVLGFAAGTQARALGHFYAEATRLQVDGVEIDPAAVEAGRAWFDLPEAPWLRTHALDARAFLRLAPAMRRYDLVLLDCFSQEYYIPFHLATREFFGEVKARLKPGGILAFNVFAYRPDDPLVAALENTVAAAFGKAWRVPVGGGGWTNFVVLARNREGDFPLERFAVRATPADLPWIARRPEGGDALAVARESYSVRVRGPFGPAPVFFDPAGTVLVDDRAPVERLTDRAIAEEDLARTGAR